MLATIYPSAQYHTRNPYRRTHTASYYYDDDLEYLQELQRRKAAIEAEEQHIRRGYQRQAYLEQQQNNALRRREASQQLYRVQEHIQQERQLRLAQFEAERRQQARQAQLQQLIRAVSEGQRAQANVHPQPHIGPYHSEDDDFAALSQFLRSLTGQVVGQEQLRQAPGPHRHLQRPYQGSAAPVCKPQAEQTQLSWEDFLTLLGQETAQKKNPIEDDKPAKCVHFEPEIAPVPASRTEQDTNDLPPIFDFLNAVFGGLQQSSSSQDKSSTPTDAPSSSATVSPANPAPVPAPAIERKAVIEKPKPSSASQPKVEASSTPTPDGIPPIFELLNGFFGAVQADKQQPTKSTSTPAASSSSAATAPADTPAEKPKSASPVQSVKESLEARLGNDYEVEIHDTIQAILQSLAMPEPTSTTVPTTPSSAVPSASAPAPAITSKGKGKAVTTDEANHEATSADVMRSLDEINSIAAAYRTLSADFSFPPHLDFSTSTQPSPIHSDSSSELTKGLAYTSANAPVRFYSHSLTALLARLDEVQSFGVEDVRKRRKEVVDIVEKALEDLEWEVEGRRKAWERKNAARDVAIPATSDSDEEDVYEPIAASEPRVSTSADAPIQSEAPASAAPSPVEDLASGEVADSSNLMENLPSDAEPTSSSDAASTEEVPAPALAPTTLIAAEEADVETVTVPSSESIGVNEVVATAASSAEETNNPAFRIQEQVEDIVGAATDRPSNDEVPSITSHPAPMDDDLTTTITLTSRDTVREVADSNSESVISKSSSSPSLSPSTSIDYDRTSSWTHSSRKDASDEPDKLGEDADDSLEEISDSFLPSAFPDAETEHIQSLLSSKDVNKYEDEEEVVVVEEQQHDSGSDWSEVEA